VSTAQKQVKQFIATWQRAARAYDIGDYTAALALYEQAREMLPDGHHAGPSPATQTPTAPTPLPGEGTAVGRPEGDDRA
jgi:hypothetical protein